MMNILTFYEFGKARYSPFIAYFDTTKTLTGSSASNQVKLPINASVNDLDINWIVDWGDGVVNTITSKTDTNTLHTYATPGVYKVVIYPAKGYWVLLNYDAAAQFVERQKIGKVLRWGGFKFATRCFRACINLDLTEVSDLPDINNLTLFEFSGVFNNCNLTFINRFSEWNYGNTTVIAPLVYSNPNFNQDIVINAPSATRLTLVWLCTSFNGNVTINAPNLTDLDQCFRQATAFNKPVHNIGIDWTKITVMTNFMAGKTSLNYNASYYDSLLITLDAAGQTNVTLGMGTIKHTAAGSTARANLVSKGWVITDGGL